MVGATSSSLGANADSHSEQSYTPLTSTTYSCSLCQSSFQDAWEQRVHMKDPWHVYNVKRRMASLPPIPFDTYNTQVDKKIDSSKPSSNDNSSSSDEEASDNEGDQTLWPYQCLFCNRAFESDENGLAANIEHMRTSHGMFIPDPEMVSDTTSFVGYLATEVRAWHECLYCGATKPSTASIQSHMKDKGHCLLNLDREPELLEFWGSQPTVDGEGAPNKEKSTNLSATEMRFASGRVIGSRQGSGPANNRKALRRRAALEASAATIKALPQATSSDDDDDAETSKPPPSNPEPQLASGRQLARREEMSLQGVTGQQRQALVLAEKKAQRTEAVARRAREWVYARASNSQKFDQLDNQHKMGKQNHKLLPR